MSESQKNRTVAVSIKNLSKIYPTPLEGLKRFFRRPIKPAVEALRDVSFDIFESEIFGLIGRNGAGKTTLTKIIATLVQPTNGNVNVKGFDSVRDEVQVRSLIGLATAEERSFYWRLTVEQNLMFFARLYGMNDSQARRRIIELLSLLQFEDLATKRFAELSTGNKQRLAVARALLPKPPVLLLDEPTRSLDPLAASRLRSLIGTLSNPENPVTILLTSHNLVEVEELCERVAIISKGEIRAIDAPTNLRMLHKQTERVTLTVKNLSQQQTAVLFDGNFDELETSAISGSTSISFNRTSEDEKLDEALRLIQTGGGKVLKVDAERATLLDVLESYEKHD